MSDNRDMADEFKGLGDRKYIVTEVIKTRPPTGIQGGNWYRYTIEHGSSPISGVRSGSPNSVRRYAEEFAESLNQRALQGYSAYAARRLQKK
jgi:hypothetical protein